MDQLRKQIVKSSFAHAKQHGFTDRAIVQACHDLGYASTSAAVIRKGPIEIVDYAMDEWLN